MMDAFVSLLVVAPRRDDIILFIHIISLGSIQRNHYHVIESFVHPMHCTNITTITTFLTVCSSRAF